MSSSAAFEVLVAGILNQLYNGGSIEAIFLARSGQFAENRYFGKPCGLMDQAASAHGGIIGIDFANPEQPVITRVESGMERAGLVLAVVDTGGSHADLTQEYAAVPAEMRAVAAALGVHELRDVSWEQLMANIGRLRQQVGDRAIQRALHFLAESPRAVAQLQAMAQGDTGRFLRLVRESGWSSVTRLQNINPGCGDGREQGIGLALSLSEDFLGGDGACRVHGGGFAGTIQAWVPEKRFAAYQAAMEAVFGPGRVCRLRIRSPGVICLR